MHARAMNDVPERARGMFACLGDASRFRIVATLAAGERCVSELAREVALSQSCTTRHLQTLKRSGLVSGERRGKRVVFRLLADDPQVDGLLRWMGRSRPVAPGARPARRPAKAAPPALRPPAAGVPTAHRLHAPLPDPAPRDPAPTNPGGPAPEAASTLEDPESARPLARRGDLEDFLL